MCADEVEITATVDCSGHVDGSGGGLRAKTATWPESTITFSVPVLFPRNDDHRGPRLVVMPQERTEKPP